MLGIRVSHQVGPKRQMALEGVTKVLCEQERAVHSHTSGKATLPSNGNIFQPSDDTIRGMLHTARC
jgi:hypothetical protein